MVILVTGGAGFLGRHVVAAALAAGRQACVLTRRSGPLAGLPPGVAVVRGDLAREDELTAAVKAARPEAVVHAAAVVDDRAPDLLAVNVEGTARLCRVLAAERGKACRLVLVSSFAVEDEPPTAYSDSKLAAEQVVASSGLPFVILRPTLIYGPGDGTNTPALVAKLRDGTMWLPAGGRTRIQPVYVADVAAAAVAAATRTGVVGRTYRLGGPEPVSVHDWRAAVRDASGGHARLRTLPLPLLEPLAHLAALAGRRGPLGVVRFHRADHAVDSAAAQAELGFRPRSSAEGLALTFAAAAG